MLMLAIKSKSREMMRLRRKGSLIYPCASFWAASSCCQIHNLCVMIAIMELATPFPGAGSHRDFDWGIRGENARKLSARYSMVPQEADRSGMIGEPGQLVATKRCGAPDTRQHLGNPPAAGYRSIMFPGTDGPQPHPRSFTLAYSHIQNDAPGARADHRLSCDQYARGILEGSCAAARRDVGIQTGQTSLVAPAHPAASDSRKKEARAFLGWAKNKQPARHPLSFADFSPAHVKAQNEIDKKTFANIIQEHESVKRLTQHAVNDASAARARKRNPDSKRIGSEFVDDTMAYQMLAYEHGGGGWNASIRKAFLDAQAKAHHMGMVRHEGQYGHLPFFVVNEGTQTDPLLTDPKGKKRKGSAAAPAPKRRKANQAKKKRVAPAKLGKQTKRKASAG